MVVILSAAARRKSNCVKEVEMIKQRREERRKQQAAIREYQEREYDTSHPNWEFEMMIRYATKLCRIILNITSDQ